jgi:preprotein translocase subunit SecG
VQDLLIGLAPFLRVIQIVLCISLVVVVVLQARSGGLGNVFGGDSSLYRTRRGLEKTLHEATILLGILFLLFALLNVLATPALA